MFNFNKFNPGYQAVDFEKNAEKAKEEEAAKLAEQSATSEKVAGMIAEERAVEAATQRMEANKEAPRPLTEIGRERWAAAGKAVNGVQEKMGQTFKRWGDRFNAFKDKAGKVGMDVAFSLLSADKLLDRGAGALNNGLNKGFDFVENGLRAGADKVVGWKNKSQEKITEIRNKTSEAVALAGSKAWRGSVEKATEVAASIHGAYESTMSYGAEQIDGVRERMSELKEGATAWINQKKYEHLMRLHDAHKEHATNFKAEADKLKRKTALQGEVSQLLLAA